MSKIFRKFTISKLFRILPAAFSWLFPGLQVKRWIFLCLLGGALSIFGGVQFFLISGKYKTLFLVIFVLGSGVLILGVILLLRSIISAVLPSRDRHIIDYMYRERILEKNPKVVAMGGGSGLSNLLSGLKEYTKNITAVVTVADEGGSSGRLRKDFDIIPPGDIRNCLVALADASELMRKLFQYRFNRPEGLKGHSFGNLFLTAMREVTGNFEDALKESSRILAIRGKVLPASLDNVRIKAELVDNSVVEGEAEIPKKGLAIRRVYLVPENARANREVLEAIKEADMIIIGPGSLFTSIIPNFLIKEIALAVKDSSALKVYVCNIMTQHGETDNFSAADHIKSIYKHSFKETIDICLVNTMPPAEEVIRKYQSQDSYLVNVDREEIEKIGFKLVEADLISEGDFVRHDPEKLTCKLIEIYEEWVNDVKNREENNNIG